MPKLSEYKCRTCNGALVFDSKLQRMKCPFCESSFTVDELSSLDSQLGAGNIEGDSWAQDITPNTWADGETDGLYSYVCRSCGKTIGITHGSPFYRTKNHFPYGMSSSFVWSLGLYGKPQPSVAYPCRRRAGGDGVIWTISPGAISVLIRTGACAMRRWTDTWRSSGSSIAARAERPCNRNHRGRK